MTWIDKIANFKKKLTRKDVLNSLTIQMGAVCEMMIMVYIWDLLKPSGVTDQISNLTILIAQHKQILHMIKLESLIFQNVLYSFNCVPCFS